MAQHTFFGLFNKMCTSPIRHMYLYMAKPKTKLGNQMEHSKWRQKNQMLLHPKRAGNINFSVLNYATGMKKSTTTELLSKFFAQTTSDLDEATKTQRLFKEADTAKEYDKIWKEMKFGFSIFGVSAIALILMLVYEFSKADVDADGRIIEDEFSNDPIVQQHMQRLCKNVSYYKQMLQEPYSHKLLPDPLKPPYIQPRYTLVLEINDVLLHPNWTLETGWRFKKRPGVNIFLQECAKYFEIVVYTAEKGVVAFPLLDALDPHGFIKHRLERDATHFLNGDFVKNLNMLNRDLSKVIVVDWDKNATKLHPNNAFNICRWNGNDNDTQLLDLTNLLKTLAAAQVEDVREVLQYYQQFEDPILHFREKQQLLVDRFDGKMVGKAKRVPRNFSSSVVKSSNY